MGPGRGHFLLYLHIFKRRGMTAKAFQNSQRPETYELRIQTGGAWLWDGAGVIWQLVCPRAGHRSPGSSSAVSVGFNRKRVGFVCLFV